MNKTFVALVAVAALTGSLAATPASAQRGLGAAVAGGIIGGAIVGGAIASSRPAYGGPVYVEDAPPPPAAGFASASGTVTPGASVASRSAADLTELALHSPRPDFENPADISAGLFFVRRGQRDQPAMALAPCLQCSEPYGRASLWLNELMVERPGVPVPSLGPAIRSA